MWSGPSLFPRDVNSNCHKPTICGPLPADEVFDRPYAVFARGANAKRAAPIAHLLPGFGSSTQFARAIGARPARKISPANVMTTALPLALMLCSFRRLPGRQQ